MRVVLTLLAHEQPIGGAYPPELAHSLREWGCVGERAPVAETPAWRSRTTPAPADATPARCRRMLHMGKVGPGYHTEIDHFRRGAPAHEGRQALDVAEALVRAGLLGEKPSVGQRHIPLERRALPEIHALIDRGETRDPVLARVWTAPAPGGAECVYGSSAGTVTVTTGFQRSSVTKASQGRVAARGVAHGTPITSATRNSSSAAASGMRRRGGLQGRGQGALRAHRRASTAWRA